MNLYPDMTTTNDRQLIGVNIDTGDVVVKAAAVEQHKQESTKTIADVVYFEAAMRELLALPKRLEALIKQVNELAEEVEKVIVPDIDDIAKEVIAEIDYNDLARDVVSELDYSDLAEEVYDKLDMDAIVREVGRKIADSCRY